MINRNTYPLEQLVGLFYFFSLNLVLIKDVLLINYVREFYLLGIGIWSLGAIFLLFKGFNIKWLIVALLWSIIAATNILLSVETDTFSALSFFLLNFLVVITFILFISYEFNQVYYSKLAVYFLVISLFAILVLSGPIHMRQDYVEGFAGVFNRNKLKEVIVIPLVMYIYSCTRAKVKIDQFLLYSCAIILAMSNSRVGFVLSFIVVIVSFIDVVKQRRHWFALMLIILLVFALYQNVDRLEAFFWGIDRLTNTSVSSAVSDPRGDVISCYSSSFNAVKLIFGLHFGGDIGCAYAAGVGVPNQHNSLLRGMSHFGLPFIFLLILISALMAFIVIRTRSLTLVLIFSMLFLVIFFESVIFVSFYDVFIYYLLFMIVKDYKNHIARAN